MTSRFLDEEKVAQEREFARNFEQLYIAPCDLACGFTCDAIRVYAEAKKQRHENHEFQALLNLISGLQYKFQIDQLPGIVQFASAVELQQILNLLPYERDRILLLKHLLPQVEGDLRPVALGLKGQAEVEQFLCNTKMFEI